MEELNKNIITVAIVEDIDIVRNGISAIIDSTHGFKSLDSYGDCESMLSKIESIKPDIILMDIGLPGISGIEGIKEVKKIIPEQTIIMLTVHDDNEHIFEALLAGASGYLLKRTPPVQLIQALTDAADGGSPMNANIAGKVISLLRETSKDSKTSEKIVFSEREYSILKGIAKGFGYKRIASDICISVSTVRYHIRSIYKKLHVNSQAEAIAKALKKGLI
ncbi:MAG: response regulator transcription factor [Melioribacteraceae bacterium]